MVQQDKRSILRNFSSQADSSRALRFELGHTLVAVGEDDVNMQLSVVAAPPLTSSVSTFKQPGPSQKYSWCHHAGAQPQAANRLRVTHRPSSTADFAQQPTHETALTSIRSSNGPGMVSSTLAVHMNSTCKGKEPGDQPVRLPTSQLLACVAVLFADVLGGTHVWQRRWKPKNWRSWGCFHACLIPMTDRLGIHKKSYRRCMHRTQARSPC